jgi:3',5'-cyclic-nucleotide phosphodiesterase
LFAAVTHDYEHPGLNNNYLVKTKSDLALIYNDFSVLGEN